MIDPRHKNIVFDGSMQDVVNQYAESLKDGICQVSVTALEAAVAAVEDAGANNRRIFVIGNGGSSAIGDHLCCDWTKGTYHQSYSSIKTQSLSSSAPLFSAIANDFGYEHVFSLQLQYLADARDLLIAISSSGNSPNILRALGMAKKLKLKVIGLTGFTGGSLKEGADISLHVPLKNYGLVEDAHQALMHIIAQRIATQRDKVG